jgi:PhnB protein
MTKINPYLNFNGNAADAIELYKSALGFDNAEIMRWSEMPEGSCGPQGGDQIMHACLTRGEMRLMLCDLPQGMSLERGNDLHVMLDFDDVDELDRAFDALAKGGEVKMAVHDSFWGARFGMLKDRFGVSWMFNCQLKQPAG